MNISRRQLLISSVSSLATLSISSLAQAKKTNIPKQSTILTITGDIQHQNRQAFDQHFDQMMLKQGVKFDKAFAFDFAMLNTLPSHTIRPTLEYDQKIHTLKGPKLIDVLHHVNNTLLATQQVLLRALDGYNINLSIQQIKEKNYLLAMYRDDRPLPIGGLGPLWAVVDADRLPELASQPLKQRFALCPWGVYHIHISQT